MGSPKLNTLQAAFLTGGRLAQPKDADQDFGILTTPQLCG